MRPLTFDQAWIRDGRKLSHGRAPRELSSSDEDYPAYQVYLKPDPNFDGQRVARRRPFADDDVNPPRRASTRAALKDMQSHAKQKGNLVTFAKERQSAVDAMLVDLSPRHVLSTNKSGRTLSNAQPSTSAAAASTFGSSRHAAATISQASSWSSDDSDSDSHLHSFRNARPPVSATVATTTISGACPRTHARRYDDSPTAVCTCGACSSRTERHVTSTSTSTRARSGGPCTAPDAATASRSSTARATATPASAADDNCRELLRALLTQMEGAGNLRRSAGKPAVPRGLSVKAGAGSATEEEEEEVGPESPRAAAPWYSYLAGKAVGASVGGRSCSGSNLGRRGGTNAGSGGGGGGGGGSAGDVLSRYMAAAVPGTARSRGAPRTAASAVGATRRRTSSSSSDGSSSDGSSSDRSGGGARRAVQRRGKEMAGDAVRGPGAANAVERRRPSAPPPPPPQVPPSPRHGGRRATELHRYPRSTSATSGGEEATDDSDVAAEEEVAQMLGSRYPHNARRGGPGPGPGQEVDPQGLLALVRTSAKQRARAAVLGDGGGGGGGIGGDSDSRTGWDPRRSVLLAAAAADGVDPGASFTSWVTGSGAVRQSTTPRSGSALGLRGRSRDRPRTGGGLAAAAGPGGGAPQSPMMISWAAVPSPAPASPPLWRRYSTPGGGEGGGGSRVATAALGGGLWRQAAALVQGDTARQRSRSVAGDRLRSSPMSDSSEESFAYRIAAAVTTARGAARSRVGVGTSASTRELLSPPRSIGSVTSRPLPPAASAARAAGPRGGEAAELDLSPLRSRSASNRLSPTSSAAARTPPSRPAAAVAGAASPRAPSSVASGQKAQNWFLTDVLRTPVGSHVGEGTTRGSVTRAGGGAAHSPRGGRSPAEGLSSPYTGSAWAQSPSQKLSLSRVWGPAVQRSSYDGGRDRSPSSRSQLSASPLSVASDDAIWRSPQQPTPPTRLVALAAALPRKSAGEVSPAAAAPEAAHRAPLGADWRTEAGRSPPLRKYTSAVADLVPRASGATTRRVLSF